MDSALSVRSITPIVHLRTPSLPTTLKPSLKPPPPPSSLSFPSHLHFTISKTLLSNPPIGSPIRVKASSNSTPRNAGSTSPNPIIQTLRTASAAVILGAAVAAKFHQFPARAETTPTILTQEKIDQNQEQEEEKSDDQSELVDSNSGAVESLKSLLQREMEAGKDREALEIVKKLVSAQPEETEWKFLMARMLSEMGSTRDARDVLEEILKLNPLDFEALFENALLMDRCGEGDAVVSRLEEALKVAEEGDKVNEARDVRLIMAQIQYLQNNVDEGNEEAREEFAKYQELSPKKVEVEGYLRSPLPRMKVFGTNEEEN